jgi:glyoxylase-like metal-dependent hydrolase (beta-lactamase superfamily II)
MFARRKFSRILILAALCIAILAAVLLNGPSVAVASPPQGQTRPSALLTENSLKHVSDHVYVLMGNPNIGIIVGERATLVVDTGMGPRNGAVVVRVASKLAKTTNLYLTTTHYHPEHASGEGAFPPNTVLIRPVAQQQELEAHAMEYVDLFRSRAALNKELLADVKFRTPDITFDKEVTIDLGGVTARLFWLGTAHTQCDELIDVEPDNTLISGDVVQNKVVPNLPDDRANVKSWVKVLTELLPLKPRFIVPDHSEVGDASLIETDYAFLSTLQARALELKRQGKSADEAGQILLGEFKTKYPDWPDVNGVPNVVKHVYAENP